MRKRELVAVLAIGVVMISGTILLIAAWLVGGFGDKTTTGTISAQPPTHYRGSHPPAETRLPSFSLPRSGAGSLDSATLKGKVVVATFVDSGCKDACPLIVGSLARAAASLPASQRARVRILAFSVDPRVDSPAHVRRFLQSHQALGRLDYLVAPTARMRPVWRAFHVLSAVDSGNMDTHSADVRIFDRGGVWRSTLHAGADLSVKNLLHDITQASKESSS
jgi:cytochrome oxidase Cu insertion factor (SCO1/SenC/PrrC family)